MPGQQKGKKSQKHGRNRLRCTTYFNRGQREENKLSGLKRHCRAFVDDKLAANTLKSWMAKGVPKRKTPNAKWGTKLKGEK